MSFISFPNTHFCFCVSFGEIEEQTLLAVFMQWNDYCSNKPTHYFTLYIFPTCLLVSKYKYAIVFQEVDTCCLDENTNAPSLYCVTLSREFIMVVATPYKLHSSTFVEKGLGTLNKCEWGPFFYDYSPLKCCAV